MPFLEELNDFIVAGALRIATFRRFRPRTLRCECRDAMVVVNDAIQGPGRTDVTPRLTTDNTARGGNPQGGEDAGGAPQPGLVLLTDGYHNCPSPATLGDPEVTALIAGSTRTRSASFHGRARYRSDYVWLRVCGPHDPRRVGSVAIPRRHTQVSTRHVDARDRAAKHVQDDPRRCAGAAIGNGPLAVIAAARGARTPCI